MKIIIHAFYEKIFLLFLFITTLYTLSIAQDIYFAENGSLIKYDTKNKIENSIPIQTKDYVSEFSGLVNGNKPLVSLGKPDIKDGYVIEKGVNIVILSSSGSVEKIIKENAIRAYPSPSGKSVAIIDLDYSLLIYKEDDLKSISIPGRVVLVAWSPDETQLCLTVYSADWSPFKVNNPENDEEFLRLINSDLWLYDIVAEKAEKLTDAPRYDYSGIFSPDGKGIFFISSRNGRGAFYIFDLQTKNIKQITNIESGSYDVPIGRSDTFVWLKDKTTIVYEAQETVDLSSIRSIKSDGSNPKFIDYGKQPKLGTDGKSVLYLSPEGKIKSTEID